MGYKLGSGHRSRAGRLGWRGCACHNSFEDCIAHAKAQSRKKARKECRKGFLNSEGQAGPVVDEVVLGDAAGRYRAFPTVAIGGHSAQGSISGALTERGKAAKKARKEFSGELLNSRGRGTFSLARPCDRCAGSGWRPRFEDWRPV